MVHMEKSRLRWLDLAWLSSLVAVGVHFYLAKQHYALKFGAGAASVCNINEKFNCDAVSMSSYAALFGIPMAVWGAVANLMLFFLLVTVRLGWTDRRETMARHALLLSVMVALASVVMAVISMQALSTYCLFCIAAYVLSFTALLGAWKGADGFGRTFGADLSSLAVENRATLVLFLAIPVVSYLTNAGTMKSYGGGQMDLMVAEKISQWAAAPEFKFDDAKGLVMQAGSAPVRMTIVEFADFLCPHCKHAGPSLLAFTRSHPDVKLVFKPFPLDAACNPDPAMGPPGDGIRCRIAAVVQCEEKLSSQGWRANHYFFEAQEAIYNARGIDQTLADYCKDHGVDCAALQACADSGETKDAIRAMAQEGVTAGIRGTPTIFVNGRLLNAGQLIPVLEEAYRNIK